MTTKASARKVEAISKALEESEAANAKQRVELENARATIEGLGQDLDKLAGQVGNLMTERHEMLARLDKAAVWEDYCRRIFEAFHLISTPNVIDAQLSYRRMMQLADHNRQLRVDRLMTDARAFAMMYKHFPVTSEIMGQSKDYAERMEHLREHWLTEAGNAYLRFDVNDNPILMCQCGEKTEFVVSWDVKVVCSAGCGAAYEFQHLAIDIEDPTKGYRTVLRRVPVPKPDSPHMHVMPIEKMIGSLVVEVAQQPVHLPVVVHEVTVKIPPAPERVHIVTKESKTCGHCGGELTEDSHDGQVWKGCSKCDWKAPVLDIETTNMVISPEAAEALEAPEPEETEWETALRTMECPKCKAHLRVRGTATLGCTKCEYIVQTSAGCRVTG